MKVPQPIGVPSQVCTNDRNMPCKRRIAHDRIEPRVLALEHLRELDLPMERYERLRGLAVRCEHGAMARGIAVDHRVGVPAPLRLALLWLVGAEVRRQHQIAEQPHRTERDLRLVPQIAQLPVGDALIGLADALAQRGDPRDMLAHPHRLEARLEAWCSGVPMKRLDLPARQANQRVAVAQRMIDEGQRMVLGQRHQPQRDLGEIDRHRVPVHAIEAALRDEPPRDDHLVLIGRDGGHLAVGVPGGDQRIAELAAGLDEERRRAHRRIADPDIEDLRGPRRAASGATQPRQDRLERRPHNRLGQCAWGVVRARAAALLARLQHQRAAGHQVGRRSQVDHRHQRRMQVFERR